MKYAATMLSVGFLSDGNSSVLKLLRTLTMKGCSEFLNLSSCG